jgi:hypothetical protein
MRGPPEVGIAWSTDTTWARNGSPSPIWIRTGVRRGRVSGRRISSPPALTDFVFPARTFGVDPEGVGTLHSTDR